MDKLKDIKDIVDINSFGLLTNLPFNFFFSILLAISLSVLMIFLIYDFLSKNSKKRFFKTQKELAYESLKNIDYSNTKDIVYKFSQNYLYFIDHKNTKPLQMLELNLYKYKYKKDIDEIDEELKKEIKEFVKGIKC
ncbi:hypothetical protein CBLAS_0572 [Campylobacter blaseri]|uniref:DUF4381 domain-containing protein n=1 Tax=Campylobacter blaseri TaxID=2042961 RepID=A0A2P8R078_9BACT|nr:hypothetical protein [Campylobacter blaseri]PSM51898.1 hypothetical protein CQ405_04855 [Campylobacter blaseri]PSM53682.1 hypothetical protein CRN67_04855 [Campylobacter blaseri]QKF85765.1 hypothetical protein CBLAS_0572 [Campylobacter blaseri]